jgi:hypothetical protein
MQKITISIGIMPLDEFRADMIAVARGERKIEPGEPQLWFVSLEALANALKTDVATVKRVLLPPPDWHADDIIERLGLPPGVDAVELDIPDHEAELQVSARAAYVASYEQDHSPLDPQLTAEFEALFADAAITPINQVAENHSDHQRLDARSLAMHCLVARKLLADPTLIAQARGTLTRWKVQTAAPVPSYFLEWERILEGRPQEIAAFLASMREDATRLRQSSPFTGLITPEERSRIYEAFR